MGFAEFFIKAFTATTLSQATGLNPMLPVLLVCVMARFEESFTSRGLPAPVTVPSGQMFVTSDWFICILIFLTLVETFGDKIAYLDTFKHYTIDLIGSPVASAGIACIIMADPVAYITNYYKQNGMEGMPPATGFIGAAETGTAFWVIMGIIICFCMFVALVFLLIKSLIRLIINALPDMGISNFLVSVVEDCLVLISSALAFFAPIPAMIFTILMGTGAVLVIRHFKKSAEVQEKLEIKKLGFVRGII